MEVRSHSESLFSLLADFVDGKVTTKSVILQRDPVFLFGTMSATVPCDFYSDPSKTVQYGHFPMRPLNSLRHTSLVASRGMRSTRVLSYKTAHCLSWSLSPSFPFTLLALSIAWLAPVPPSTTS